jgi:hypothetical protein
VRQTAARMPGAERKEADLLSTRHTTDQRC